ncbi:MAG: hypothetical protein A3I09_04205 [Deltaproteobacteria bacterium RIFCSPLOWO2_02_FULL_47_10]|nr:MAG: hypothetical protein A3I09_04205 [Deltaproteobacteria bacterium RIFCSPLOWO2_02_FULL_47_10]
MWWLAVVLISGSGVGDEFVAGAIVLRTGLISSAAASSIYVFHWLHSGHLPSHFGDCAPQFWQVKIVDVFGTGTYLAERD